MTSPPGYTLAHPVYLDVPMMISFLAALEGGVAMSGEETSTEVGARERMLTGRTGIRAKLFGFGDGEVSFDGTAQSRDETSFVSQTQRHHTAASLFNVLYGYLREDEQIQDIQAPGQLSEVRAGQLVEFSGEYLGNPLENILVFFKSLFPYIAPEPEPEPEPPVAAPASKARSGNPAKRAAQPVPTTQAADSAEADGIKIMKMMGADIETAPVHDLLFRTTEGLEAVVTVASEFYTPTTSEHLRQGEFRVVGKVTRVLGEHDAINLTRRTVMGAAGPQMAEETIGQFSALDALTLDIAKPIVAGPAIQVLPMSIFV
jgi:hypothetical protein